MKYQVVLEHDSATGTVTATVPGLPIVVDANTEREALAQAREAILFWFEQHPAGKQGTVGTQPSSARVATVDI